MTRLSLIALLIVSALAWTASPSLAQSPPVAAPPHLPTAQAPEEQQQRASSAFNAMVPLMTKMAEDSSEAQLRIAERPETTERIATFKKNLFDALRRKGFTAEQALQIVATTPIYPYGVMNR